MVQWPRCVQSNQCTAQSIQLDHIPSLRDKQLSAAVQGHLHEFCMETTHTKCCQTIHQCQITSHHTTNYMHASGKKVLNWTINSENFNYGSENLQNIMSIQWQSFILQQFWMDIWHIKTRCHQSPKVLFWNNCRKKTMADLGQYTQKMAIKWSCYCYSNTQHFKVRTASIWKLLGK